MKPKKRFNFSHFIRFLRLYYLKCFHYFQNCDYVGDFSHPLTEGALVMENIVTFSTCDYRTNDNTRISQFFAMCMSLTDPKKSIFALEEVTWNAHAPAKLKNWGIASISLVSWCFSKNRRNHFYFILAIVPEIPYQIYLILVHALRNSNTFVNVLLPQICLTLHRYKGSQHYIYLINERKIGI